jgi:hypothetical protein
MGIRNAIGVFGIVLSGTPIHGEEMSAPEQARVGMAQWDCAVLESLKERSSGDLNEFFMSGLANLSFALSDYLREDLTEEQAASFPWEFRVNVGQGPSKEFILGMIWAKTQEKIFSKMSSGLPVEEANRLFVQKNCPALAIVAP